jgi:hypothetical protein
MLFSLQHVVDLPEACPELRHGPAEAPVASMDAAFLVLVSSAASLETT